MHFSNHKRDTFEAAIRHLMNGGSYGDSPSELEDINGEPITVQAAITKLWSCSDTMPDHLFSAANELFEAVLTSRTYGAVARAIHNHHHNPDRVAA
jgi:hypothetical protein